MEWKIFSMEWEWNWRKFPVWNKKKSSSIPSQTMPWRNTTKIWHCKRYSGISSLALASKPRSPGKCPFLGRGQRYVFDLLKTKWGRHFVFFVWNFTKNLPFSAQRPFFLKTLLFGGNTSALCPWSLASSILVLGLDWFCPRKVGPCPRIFFMFLALASSIVSSTPNLLSNLALQSLACFIILTLAYQSS